MEIEWEYFFIEQKSYSSFICAHDAFIQYNSHLVTVSSVNLTIYRIA